LSVVSLALSTDGTMLYAVLDSTGQYFFVIGIDVILGQPVWWAMATGTIVGEKTNLVLPTPLSPRGWITLHQPSYIDIFIPPLYESGEIDYTTHVRTRVPIIPHAVSTSPLLSVNGYSYLVSRTATITYYTIIDEKATIVGNTMIMEPCDLAMVTPSNTGILYNANSYTTFLLYFNATSGVITQNYQQYLRPGGFLGFSVFAPFLVFVRHDKASDQAWVQVSPEPLFPKVLWTVPTGLNFYTETFEFSMETGLPADGLIPGIIYYQTSTQVTAIDMHEGDFYWSYPLNGNSSGSPIVGTVSGMNKYLFFVMSNLNNVVTLTSLACCSSNGLCPMGTNTCNCSANYSGAQCTVFCDAALCTAPKGKCTTTGCVCSAGFYGPTCQIPCTAQANCNNHGTCSANGTCVCHSANNVDFGIYSGMNCDVKQINWFFIGTIIGVFLVAILLIAITVVACKKGKVKKVRHHLKTPVE